MKKIITSGFVILTLGILFTSVVTKTTNVQAANPFTDVPTSYWAYTQIDSLYNGGIVGGCTSTTYCPENALTRDQIAVMLLKAIHGASYNPPAVGASTGFDDVATNYWAAPWIKELVVEGISSGCTATSYCPTNPVNRDQVAVFILKARHGSNYVPPAVGASSGFNDVATTYWAAAWIKQFAAEGYTSGCGAGNYCPTSAVTRAQGAVFIYTLVNNIPLATSTPTCPPAQSCPKILCGSGGTVPNGSCGITVCLDMPACTTPTVPTTPAPIFTDVPATHWAVNYIETLYKAGIISGCYTSPLKYCPEDLLTRAQISVILLKAKNGANYFPSAVGPTTGFTDVPTDHWAAAWIKQLVAEGITAGCTTTAYCPDSPVNRDQIAVFLLKAKYGSSYWPPAVGPTTGFTDVPTDHWAAAWIKQLVAEGITAGCGTGIYCPSNPVTRAQATVFITKALPLLPSVIAPTDDPSCICKSDNTCASACTFNKSADVNYNNPIRCSQDGNALVSVPTANQKNDWCRSTLRTKGDVDGNEKVDLLDYYYYVSAINGGKVPASANVDVDGDGTISTFDRTIILKFQPII